MAILVIFSHNTLRIKTQAFNKALELGKQTNQDVIPVIIEDNQLFDVSKNSNAYNFYQSAIYYLNEDFFTLYKFKIPLFNGDFNETLNYLLLKYNISDVFLSVVYEPSFLNFYKHLISTYLKIDFHFFNDSLLHTPKNILNKSGEPYQVFTPFYNNLLEHLKLNFKCSTSKVDYDKLVNATESALCTPVGNNKFNASSSNALKVLNEFIENKLIDYKNNRDIPHLNATSNISAYLRFGILDVNFILEKIINIKNIGAEVFIKELIWREFAYYVAYYFPNILHTNHKALYNNFQWNDNKETLEKFKQGLNGYPIIDAGVLQLITTGNMHNRVRMVVASFLIKNLHYSWQVGASWFRDYLIDYDVVINSFSWQWVAGCGFDAAPYFRVFNPKLQHEKFDPLSLYIRQYVSSLCHYKPLEILNLYDDKSLLINYVDKIVDFKSSRESFLSKIIKK